MVKEMRISILVIGMYIYYLLTTNTCIAVTNPATTATPLADDLDINQYSLLNVKKVMDVRNAAEFPSIQAAIDDLPGGNSYTTMQGGIVLLPSGIVNVSTTIKLVNKWNVRLVGNGTTLKWTGTSGPVIWIANNRYIKLENIVIDGNGVVDSGLHIHPDAALGGSGTTDLSKISNVIVRNMHYSGRGIVIGNDDVDVGTFTTAEIYLEDIEVRDQNRYGVQIQRDYTDNITFIRPLISGSTIGGMEIRVPSGGGPYNLYGPVFGANAVDILVDGGGRMALQEIGGWAGETSTTHLKVTDNAMLAALLQSSVLTASLSTGDAILWTGTGVLQLIGNVINRGKLTITPAVTPAGRTQLIELGNLWGDNVYTQYNVSNKVPVFSMTNDIGLGGPTDPNNAIHGFTMGNPTTSPVPASGLKMDTSNKLIKATGVKGISGTNTTASENLRGQATLNAGTGSQVVTFPTAEPDASYYIQLTGDGNQTLWVTNKTATGFTINRSSTTGTRIVDWLLIR